MPKEPSPLDRLKECRDSIKALEGGIHRQKYECLAKAYSYALEIADNEEAFKEFSADAFFTDREKALKREDALRLCFVFLYEALDGPLYDRACTYARALQPSFNDEKEPDEIPDFIEDSGGIEKLYRDIIAREKREALGLQIEANSEELDEVLSTDVGQETEIRVVRLEDGKGGWIRFGIVSMDVNVA